MLPFEQAPPDVSPEAFEAQVVAWLRSSGKGLHAFEVQHRRLDRATSGEYEIDAIATFEALGGARFKVLVECKHWRRKVDRDVLLALWAKGQELQAHKLMVVTNSGFQTGALKYAHEHGIATIVLSEGRATYGMRSRETRALTLDEARALGIPDFVGWWCATKSGTQTIAQITDEELGPLIDWLGTKNMS